MVNESDIVFDPPPEFDKGSIPTTATRVQLKLVTGKLKLGVYLNSVPEQTTSLITGRLGVGLTLTVTN